MLAILERKEGVARLEFQNRAAAWHYLKCPKKLTLSRLAGSRIDRALTFLRSAFMGTAGIAIKARMLGLHCSPDGGFLLIPAGSGILWRPLRRFLNIGHAVGFIFFAMFGDGKEHFCNAAGNGNERLFLLQWVVCPDF